MTTPMMQQYQDARARHPGMLLLFRMGDFYELFDADAELAARLLGLTLTSRDKTVPMAGFPHHQLENYLHKLIQAGQRVAICDQVEDPALAKGLVRREVTRVVTPGTITEDNLLDPRAANYLAALRVGKDEIGLAWLELSTGQFQAADLPWDRLADELARLQPAETLIAESVAAKERESPAGEDRESACSNDALALLRSHTARPDWTFEPDSARACLHRHFGVTTLEGFGFQEKQPCLCAAGALLLYVQETLKADLGHIRRLEPFQSKQFLLVDEVTRRSLELTRTIR